jgi:hypothetical protein
MLESILGALERYLETFLNRTPRNTGITGVWTSYNTVHLAWVRFKQRAIGQALVLRRLAAV